MLYLILILGSVLLFAVFLGLTIVEARSGKRMLAPQRAKLDKIIAQYTFVAKHVDWTGFIESAAQSAFERVIHDVAQAVLICVRFIERQLTGLVRTLRTRRPNMLAPKPSRTPALVQVSRFARRRLRILGKKREHEEF
jgi:hypothetical protein